MQARPVGFEPTTVRLEGGLSRHNLLIISSRKFCIFWILRIYVAFKGNSGRMDAWQERRNWNP